ncbi:MAG: hypothetical protein J7K12_05290, partial [Thermoplasmata archaeon]|nr:hypothetical protein [Thermoplasmata archaeon]
NGGTPHTVGTSWTVVNSTNFGASGYVTAGDYFEIGGVTGNVQITLKYNPTNTIIGTWTVNV